MKLDRSATRTFGVTLAGAAVALLVGFWEGHVFVWLALYALALAGWNLLQRERFAGWLEHGGDNTLPGRYGQLARVIERRRRADRERARELKSRLRQYYEASKLYPDGVIMLDANRRIEWMNPAAARMLDLDAQRDIGHRIQHLVRHPKLHLSIESGDPSASILIESPFQSPEFLSLQAVAVPPDARMLVVRDVTERESAETARRDFVANASHELRSPLTVIRGYVDALADDAALDPAWRGPVDEMQRQAQRMSDLLRDLMDLARLDRVYCLAEFKPIPMRPLLEQIRRDLVPVGDRRRVELQVNDAVQLRGERAEIALVVTNLLGNALRYTGHDGHIVINWEVDRLGARLAVSDNGIGIPDEDIPRLTQRFYRVDKGRSRAEGGTGLGLAIVRNALERHDAKLEIKSRLGAGSEFVCHFPPERVAAVDAGTQLAS